MPSRGSNEEDLIIHDADLEGEDFSYRKLRHLSIAGSRLIRCNFRGLAVASSGLGGGRRQSTYIECNFDGSKIRRALGGRAVFVGCSFQEVSINNGHFLDCEFVDCSFSGVLKTVIFSASPESSKSDLGRERNSFRGNDFTRAQLIDVDFRGGIDLADQQLPEGSDYVYLRDAGPVLLKVRRQIEKWPDLEQRRAESILSILEWQVEAGQEDIFFNVKSFVLLGKNPDAERAFLELLQDAAKT